MPAIYTARDLPALRTAAYQYLKKKRVRHVQGCEKEAYAIALKYGADPVQAAVAAILHDITKALDLNDQLILSTDMVSFATISKKTTRACCIQKPEHTGQGNFLI